jgi:hypothetical protein
MEEAMNVGVTFLIALCGYLLAISAVVTLSAYHHVAAAGALLALAIFCSSTSLIANLRR